MMFISYFEHHCSVLKLFYMDDGDFKHIKFEFDK